MPEELTLLPCPACGGKADIIDAFERDDKGHVAIGWSAYCTRGCLTISVCGVPFGDEHGSREKAAALWNALPRALEWTNELPKVPGWYWWRNLSKPQVVHSNNFKNRKPHPADEWAGPIPEPREPK